MRAALFTLLALVLLAMPDGARAAAATKPARTIQYSIGSRGVHASHATMSRFRDVVAATLNDPRGWSLSGRVAFDRVQHGAFQVTLASPAVVGSFPGCTRQHSCRSGRYVLINFDRWEHGTTTYRGQALLQPYRQHVINHEVGHALGFHHAHCSHAGALAPVMQQQTIALHGCRRNSWPLLRERRALARRLGVSVAPLPARLVVGEAAGGIALGEGRGSVLAKLGDPQRRAARPGGGRIETYSYWKLSVEYAAGRVAAVTTRSPSDRSFDGLRVGISRSAAVKRLPGATCSTSGTRETCTKAAGGAATTITIVHGAVTAIRIETTA